MKQASRRVIQYPTTRPARWQPRLWSVLCCAGVLMSWPAFGEEVVELSLKPQRCVALHQGQMCYQTVTVTWRAQVPDNYCVFQQGLDEPLRCWLAATQGELRHEFVSDTTLVIELRAEQDSARLAESRLEVAWVYNRNTRRKSHWRIF